MEKPTKFEQWFSSFVAAYALLIKAIFYFTGINIFYLWGFLHLIILIFCAVLLFKKRYRLLVIIFPVVIVIIYFGLNSLDYKLSGIYLKNNNVVGLKAIEQKAYNKVKYHSEPFELTFASNSCVSWQFYKGAFSSKDIELMRNNGLAIFNEYFDKGCNIGKYVCNKKEEYLKYCNQE